MRHRPSFRHRVAVLAGTVLLSGCQTFSPDGGLTLPAAIVGGHLNKEITAIHSEGEAAAARHPSI